MRKLPLTIFLLLSALGLQGMADTIILKSGEKIEGSIIQETDSQVTISVQVSASISDERTVKREEIDKVVKPTEDELVFDQIKNLKIDSMAMLAPESYKNAIDALKSFQEKFPQSTHKAEVQTILDTFLDEKKHQDAGETKLYGLWIPAKEAALRATQIQGQGLLFKMKSFIAQGDLIAAMNTFELMEKSYNNTRAYPLSIELAKSIEPTLQAQVARASENLKINNEKWGQGVAITPEPRKSEIIAARRAELERYDAMIENATKSQLKWPPFIAESDKSLDALQTLLTAEKTHLLSLTLDKMNASVAATDKASEAISANDLTTADNDLKNALLLWPVNEEAQYYQKWITDFRAAKEAAKAHPDGPKPIVQKVASRPTPVGAATPTPSATPKPTPVPTPAQPTVGEEKDSGGIVGFFFTIPGAITVVVVLVGFLGLLSFLQKNKKAKGDDIEV